MVACQHLSPDLYARFMPLANAVLRSQVASEYGRMALTRRASLTQELVSEALMQPLAHVAHSDAGCYAVGNPSRSALTPARTFIDWILAVAK